MLQSAERWTTKQFSPPRLSRPKPLRTLQMGRSRAASSLAAAIALWLATAVHSQKGKTTPEASTASTPTTTTTMGEEAMEEKEDDDSFLKSKLNSQELPFAFTRPTRRPGAFSSLGTVYRQRMLRVLAQLKHVAAYQGGHKAAVAKKKLKQLARKGFKTLVSLDQKPVKTKLKPFSDTKQIQQTPIAKNPKKLARKGLKTLVSAKHITDV